MKRLFALFTGVTLFLGISSCETDFSLNGDYEITPVVFGLLDHTDTIHYVKITKAFLGDGDNLLYAQIADSSYFESVDARISEFDENGEETGRNWSLQDTLLSTKSEDGIFYAPEQKVYFFKANDLNSEYSYKLDADLNEGEHQISAETEMVHNFAPSSFVSFPTYRIPFAKNVTSPTVSPYLLWKFDCSEALNGARYTLGYTFYWTEYYTDGSSTSFSNRKDEEDHIQTKPESPSSFAATFQGESFYDWVGSMIPEDPEVTRRTADSLAIHFSIAHYNLDQFMSVSEPVTGIAQIQPTFTNIDGGFGLFSSRHLYTLNGKLLNANSVKELARGQYTIGLLFCSEYPEHNTEDFFCD